ncbi:hypothetical protein V5P93_005705 [Actinokineospora auranticolor]|uniref:Uncharacterized protein n=1 Tax=Actinokineospora auranticolor TaxID=155976 RepID=A0A2S6GF88_9PSEU|nr:hypothetical protein [Actinokineospora auranticolor]PPK63831.1 hypothetical protein CLV40_12475 [Actinokineospora auranticolor]
MRALELYCRERGVPAAVAVMVAAVVALAPVGRLTGSMGMSLAMSVLATAVAVGAACAGLAGADPDLARTAAIAWPPRRAAHLVAIAALALALAFVVEQVSPSGIPTEVLLRNVIGLAGLGALGVAVLGSSRGWVFPLVVASAAMTALLSGAPTGPALAFSWPVQPADLATTWYIAGAFAAIGSVTYVIRG